jgi:molecular chaperone DnaK
LIHGTKKSLEDLAEQVEADEKSAIESAIAELEEAAKGEDKDAIEAKVTSLSEAAGKLAEKAYAKAQAEAGGDESAEQAETAPVDDNVVDAEFEEVEDDKKD